MSNSRTDANELTSELLYYCLLRTFTFIALIECYGRWCGLAVDVGQLVPARLFVGALWYNDLSAPFVSGQQILHRLLLRTSVRSSLHLYTVVFVLSIINHDHRTMVGQNPGASRCQGRSCFSTEKFVYFFSHGQHLQYTILWRHCNSTVLSPRNLWIKGTFIRFIRHFQKILIRERVGNRGEGRNGEARSPQTKFVQWPRVLRNASVIRLIMQMHVRRTMSAMQDERNLSRRGSLVSGWSEQCGANCSAPGRTLGDRWKS